MAEHLHISALNFVIVACYIIIFAITWRTIQQRLSDRPIGKAMSVVL